jgi:hypothetical protein
VSLAVVVEWLDPAFVTPNLGPRRPRGARIARASLKHLQLAAQSVADALTVFWEQSARDATVPQHADAVLFSQRHRPPAAITEVCLGCGCSTADPHIPSSRPIYVEASAFITMPLFEPSGVQLLPILPMYGSSTTLKAARSL